MTRRAKKLSDYDRPFVTMLLAYARVVGVELRFELRSTGMHCQICPRGGNVLTAVNADGDVTIDEFLYAIHGELDSIYRSILQHTNRPKQIEGHAKPS